MMPVNRVLAYEALPAAADCTGCVLRRGKAGIEPVPRFRYHSAVSVSSCDGEGTRRNPEACRTAARLV